MESPRVFISYSWDNNEHTSWVKKLADKLLEKGVIVILDQYDLKPGDRLPKFMEEEIVKADYVLIICTKKYKEKADNRTNGVGYEGNIISGELYSKNNEKKFIPIVRQDEYNKVMPIFLIGKLAHHLTGELDIENIEFKKLLFTLFNKEVKPKVGNIPEYIKQPTKIDERKYIYDEIKIVDIIREGITIPKNDGTPGAALYTIPFKLSSKPSKLWIDLFLKEWDMPISATTMHRPGIAHVHNDTIILNGTTIEEVKNYHIETLKLCIEEANKKEKHFLQYQKEKEKQKRSIVAGHYDNVNQVIDKISFD